jgi:radical SAM superfamily enzyme YgiQ (UPF0313 family)
MKIALLKPHTGGVLGLEMITFVEPLGLEYVAGALEPDGHECLIVDLRIDGVGPGLARCRDFEPDLVGLQCNFTTERFRTVETARWLRRELPDAFILAGGHDVSREPGWFTDPSIDAAALGDGEEVMPPLVDALESRGDLRKVAGLMINGKNGPEFTGPAPARRNLDELPLPARHLIRDYAGEYYFNFHKPMALVETARGCPFKCNFCSVWKFHESTFREKSPERVVEELRQVEADHVFFTDDIFWMNVKRAKEMARQIKAAGIRKYFKFQTRSDIICRHPEVVETWKECGKLSIFLGLEKIDDEGLASVNKKNRAANNNRAVEILQELGVGYTPNFIVDPDWDLDHFAKLREWVSRTGAYNAGFSILTPLPGTDLWDDVKDRVNTDNWELFDIAHTVLPTTLPLEEFYREYAGLWRHALETRYKHQGQVRTYAQMGLALATGKLTMAALRKGMNLNKRFSRPETFLKAHQESPARMAAIRQQALPVS